MYTVTQQQLHSTSQSLIMITVQGFGVVMWLELGDQLAKIRKLVCRAVRFRPLEIGDSAAYMKVRKDYVNLL